MYLIWFHSCLLFWPCYIHFLINQALWQNFWEYDLWLAAENGMFLRRTRGEWMTTMPEHLNMEWVDSLKVPILLLHLCSNSLFWPQSLWCWWYVFSMFLSISPNEHRDHILSSVKLPLFGITSMQVLNYLALFLSKPFLPFIYCLTTVPSHNYMVSDIEFGRIQARDMLQHLWTGPISNASVEVVQGSRSVEVRAVGVTKVIHFTILENFQFPFFWCLLYWYRRCIFI